MKFRKRQSGGEVAIKFAKPEVSETSSSSAIKGSMENQKQSNQEMAEMQKQMSGGGDGVVVPQMDQAGDSGNQSISGGIGNILQGAADSEYDNDVDTNSSANSDYTGGKRKRRRRTKKRRKSKKRRKTRKRRKSKKRRKSRKKRKTRRRKGGWGKKNHFKRTVKGQKETRNPFNLKVRAEDENRRQTYATAMNEFKRATKQQGGKRKRRRRTRKKKAGSSFFKKNKLMIEGMSEGTIRRLDNSDTSFPAIMRARSNIKSGMDPIKAHRKAFNNSHLKVKDLKAVPKYLEWKKRSSAPLVEKTNTQNKHMLKRESGSRNVLQM